MPTHIVDGRGAVVEPVGQRSDLVQRPPFGDLFKSAVDIAYGLLRRDDPFAVALEDILEHAVGGRVRGPEVEGRSGLLDAAFGQFDMLFDAHLQYNLWCLPNQTSHHLYRSGSGLPSGTPCAWENIPSRPH